TRTHHGVDHTAGGTSVFHGVAAGLDLELLVKGIRRFGKAVAVVEVGDVEAVDVERVLGNGRAAEGKTTEGSVSALHARCHQGDGGDVALHRNALQLLARDVHGRSLGRADVDDR